MHRLVDQTVGTLPYRNSYVLSSTDHSVRFHGSSGGFVTAFARYLFRTEKIRSAICFDYQGRALFAPRIAFSADEYVQSGSIYHEIPLVRFLQESVSRLRSPVLVTCLPCQCRPIRQFLEANHISSILVALVCSGQLSKQATYDFLAKHGIDLDRVAALRYRGEGWPSGITVTMTDGRRHFFHNLDSDWKCFFHSGIYNLKRCLGCPDTYGRFGDLCVADPWLEPYVKSETIGCSVVCVPDSPWTDILEEMVNTGSLHLHARLSVTELVRCQFWTVAKKASYRRYGPLRWAIRVFRSPVYRRIFLWGNYRYWHYRMYMKLLGRYRKRLYAKDRPD